MFAFAALRVKGLYLALSTLALQFVMDWMISHVPAISGGTQATLQAPTCACSASPCTSDAGLYYVALVWCILVTLLHAQPAAHRARPRAGRGAREGLTPPP